MNIKGRLLKMGLVFLSLTSTIGCYYNKEDLLYPGPACDVTGVTYGATVTGILTVHCYSCHSSSAGNANGGGIILDSYNRLYPYVTNGKLMGSINHASGHEPMPKNATKLNSCDIQKIQAWVNAGAPNN